MLGGEYKQANYAEHDIGVNYEFHSDKNLFLFSSHHC